MNLIFIRHGYTKENYEGRYLGKTDVSLCKDGVDQLSRLSKEGIYPDIHGLFSGPMTRCQETGEILYPAIKPVIIDELTEMDFGDFECKTYQELNGNPDYQRYIDSGGETPFPNGESKADFIKRSQRGFERIVDIISKDNDNLTWGIICHGGNIMAILSENYGGEYFNYACKPGQGYVCNFDINSKKITDIKPLGHI